MRIFGKQIAPRRLVVIMSVLLLYFGGLALSFSVGRAFYVYIDNSDSEDGTALADEDGISVSIDGGEASEFYPGDKDRIRLRGSKHSIAIERFMDGSTLTKTIDIKGFGDSVVVFLPMLIEGKEPALGSFKPFVAPENEDFTPGTTDGSDAFVPPEQIKP